MGQPKPPSPPDPADTFRQGIQTWLQNLPRMLKAEQRYRRKIDPQRIEAQQALQGKYGPTQYAQQLAALRQLDPTGYGLREDLGARISSMLARGNVDPLQAQGYRALGTGTIGDYGRGAALSPSLRHEIANAIGARQAAGGNISGNAPAMAEAVYTGQRAQQLQQQRTQNLAGFLGIQTPEEKALAQAGGFLGLPGPVQQVGQIQGVSPDRSFAFANPNAGYMGQQFGLQNYPNQFAGMGGPNPWMGALTGAAGGAATGATFGPYGALAGGIIGGGLGYFSDPRMKTDVKKIGDVGIYEYKYKPRYGIPGTFRGPMSTDVKKLDSGAVTRVFGHDFVRSPNSLGLNRVKVKED